MTGIHKHNRKSWSDYERYSTHVYDEKFLLELFHNERDYEQQFLCETGSPLIVSNAKMVNWKSDTNYVSRDGGDYYLKAKFSAPITGEYNVEVLYRTEEEGAFITLWVMDNNEINYHLKGSPEYRTREIHDYHLQKGEHEFNLHCNANIHVLGIVIKNIVEYRADDTLKRDSRLTLIKATHTVSKMVGADELKVELLYDNSWKDPTSLTDYIFDYREEVNFHLINTEGEMEQVFGGYVSACTLNSQETILTISCAGRLIDGEKRYIVEEMSVGGDASNLEDNYPLEYTRKFDNYNDATEYLFDNYEQPLNSNMHEIITAKQYDSISFAVMSMENYHRCISENVITELLPMGAYLRNNNGINTQRWFIYNRDWFGQADPICLDDFPIFYVKYGMGEEVTTLEAEQTQTDTSNDAVSTGGVITVNMMPSCGCCVGTPYKHYTKSWKNYCLAYDTELIVRKDNQYMKIAIGELFDKHKEDIKDFEIRSFNIDTKKIEWKQINEVQKNPIRPLFESTFANGSSIVTTADHKFYNRYLCKEEAKDNQRCFIFNREHDLDFNKNLNDLYELYGFVLGDGSLQIRGNNRRIIFGFTKKEKFDYLLDLCERNNCKYSILNAHEGEYKLNINSHEQLFELLGEDKYNITQQVFKYDEAYSILKGLMKSDGSFTCNKIRFSNKNENILDLFELCCEICGYRTGRRTMLKDNVCQIHISNAPNNYGSTGKMSFKQKTIAPTYNLNVEDNHNYFVNHLLISNCPACGKSGTLTDNPKGVYEGEITCSMSKGGCDADYCGYCGGDKWGSGRCRWRKLTPASGSEVSSNSGDSSTTENISHSTFNVFMKIIGVCSKYSYGAGVSTVNEMRKKGFGDDIAFSDLIYSELVDMGVGAKITQYPVSGMTRDFRSVLVKNTEGKYVDFPYLGEEWQKQFGTVFNPTSQSLTGTMVAEHDGMGVEMSTGTITGTNAVSNGFDKDKPFKCYWVIEYSIYGKNDPNLTATLFIDLPNGTYYNGLPVTNGKGTIDWGNTSLNEYEGEYGYTTLRVHSDVPFVGTISFELPNGTNVDVECLEGEGIIDWTSMNGYTGTYTSKEVTAKADTSHHLSFIDFTASQSDDHMTWSGLTPIFLNNIINTSTLSVIDKMREFYRTPHVYLHKLYCEYVVGAEELWSNSESNTDNSSYRMILQEVGFRNGTLLNPVDLGSTGKTINSVLQTVVDNGELKLKFYPARHRRDDKVILTKDKSFNPSFVIDESKNVLNISNWSFTPVSDFIDRSLVVFKNKVDGDADKGAVYNYTESRNPNDILRYGEINKLTSLSDDISSQEAYYNARKEFKSVVGDSMTITVFGCPKNLHIGDYVECLFEDDAYNDVKEVKSIERTYSINQAPHIQTKLGLNRPDPELSLRNKFEEERKVAKEHKTLFSRTAVYDDEVYTWEE